MKVKLMPKISTILEQSLCMKDYIDKYEKMEIQFFQETIGSIEIKIEEVVDRYIKAFNVREITIHPPLERFHIEYLLLRDEKYVDNLIDRIIILSKKYNIQINLLFHTDFHYEELRFAVAPKLEKILKKIENENVLLLLENLIFNGDKEECSVIEFCNYVNHPKLKVCLDTCHFQAKANLFQEDIYEFVDHFLDKEKCKKQIYQIHFSYVANNDGYRDKSTHGVAHKTKEDLIKDVEILRYLGIENKLIVTEIGENDYSVRIGQRQELKWLEEVL